MPSYHRQLTVDCTHPNCRRVFCRKLANTKTIVQVEKILSAYRDIFHCCNIQALLDTDVVIYSHPVIDIFFYVNTLINNSLEKNGRQCEGIILQEKADSTRAGGANVNHSYCKFVGMNHTATDKYLLIGVTHLLLSLFKRKRGYFAALVALRLFIVTASFSSVDSAYFEILETLFGMVYRQVNGRAEFHIAKTECCEGANCIFQAEFSKSDLTNSISVISDLLNACLFTDIRENVRTSHLLNIFKTLYKINSRAHLIEPDKFYLNNFCSKINLRTELRYLRNNQKSILDYVFILPIQAKAELLRIENGDSMKSILQDAFFRSLFEGVTEPYLLITIRRSHVYEDTLRILEELEEESLKKQLKIRFLGEEGVDSGGIKKEYFQLLSQEIAEDSELFQILNNTIWFKPGASLVKYRQLGKIFGLALYNDAILNIPFPFLLFKKILGVPLCFRDLADIAPENFNSLMNLKKCTEEELLASDLYFVVDYMVGGNSCVEELFENGREIQVCRSNLGTFCQAYSIFYTKTLIQKEFAAFLGGFKSAIKSDTLKFIEPRELERIVIGVENISIDILEQNTTYTGYAKTSSIIRSFWKIFREYDIDHCKKLLQFITGNDRIPVSGLKASKLVIIKNGGDTDRLPSSQTCFNTLLLPEYGTEEKLREKLSKAINMTAGFFLP